MIKSRN